MLWTEFVGAGGHALLTNLVWQADQDVIVCPERGSHGCDALYHTR